MLLERKVSKVFIYGFLKIRYRYYIGKKLNLDNPVEFNEKIQWLKLYYQVPILTQLADKYEVRKYVEEKIGVDYLNELYGVYEDVDQVNFDELPNQFVLKGVHGSSLNLIVSDKNQLNIENAKATMKKWLNHNQYKRVGYEWAYKNIQPKIIAEKFLKEESQEVLIDYKLYCFNGEPKFVQVISERDIKDYRCYYDLNWNKMPFNTAVNQFDKKEFDKPKKLGKMINLARSLANNFPFSRVDFYYVNNKIIFGEITFYPTDGKKDYYPEKYNKILGDYINLPKIPKGKKVITSLFRED